MVNQNKCYGAPYIPFIIFIINYVISFLGTVLKEGIVCDEDLEELSISIGKDWMRLGRRLGVSHPELDEIEERWPYLREKAYRMLRSWKQKNSSNATYRILRQALCHEFVKRRNLAEKICFH